MTVKFKHSDLDNTLKDQTSYKNILVFNISYKTLIGAKPLRIRSDKKDGLSYDKITLSYPFDQIDGFIKIDGFMTKLDI